MRRIAALAALATLAALGVTSAGAPAAAQGKARAYEVTIRNLTDGQPFSPPVVATHLRDFSVFDVGRSASFGVKEIAENGNNAPLLAALEGSAKVADVEGGSAPLVPDGTPGGEMFDDRATFRLMAPRGADRFSLVTMLVCTNDGFTGGDALRLPTRIGDRAVFQSAGYDAGTEINTEDFADLVPPCQEWIGVSSGEPGTGTSNPALREGGVIHHHPGIAGIADLVPSVHGWTDPVARITVERVR